MPSSPEANPRTPADLHWTLEPSGRDGFPTVLFPMGRDRHSVGAASVSRPVVARSRQWRLLALAAAVLSVLFIQALA